MKDLGATGPDAVPAMAVDVGFPPALFFALEHSPAAHPDLGAAVGTLVIKGDAIGLAGFDGNGVGIEGEAVGFGDGIFFRLGDVPEVGQARLDPLRLHGLLTDAGVHADGFAVGGVGGLGPLDAQAVHAVPAGRPGRV